MYLQTSYYFQGEFNSNLEPLLTKIRNKKKPCYLTGDFNMDLLKHEKEKKL